MPEYDRALMAMRGRIGAYASHSRHDSRELTANARAAFKSKFVIEVDPDGLLEPEERARRADQARRAFYAKIAYLSAAKRRGERAKRDLRRAGSDKPGSR